ncbi:hypothetical protein ACQEUV_33215 [Micromonospora aurantiaca (nom. illeg.)]
MQDVTRPDAPAIRLRVDLFDAMTTLLGYRSDVARAEFIDVTPRTINRARAGIIGEQFMAKTVAALAPHADRLAEYNLRPTLNDLFEVVSASADQAA